MTNRHRNNKQTERSFPFNLNAMSILGFCRAIDSQSEPPAQGDMFSRWIKLSDNLLDQNWKTKKRSVKGSKKYGIAFSAKPA